MHHIQKQKAPFFVLCGLVCKWVWLQPPKSIQTPFQCQGLLRYQFRMFSVLEAIVSTDERDDNDGDVDKPITSQIDSIVFIWDMHYLSYR
jgi:hypothetical protein